MPLKKKVLIPLGITIVLGLAIGGVIMINPFTGKEEPRYKHEQDRIANYLVEHYELTNGDDIKTVEVTEFQKIDMAGFWSITVKVNNKHKISFTEDKLGKEITTSNYSPKEFRIRENTENKRSLSGVELIYYD